MLKECLCVTVTSIALTLAPLGTELLEIPAQFLRGIFFLFVEIKPKKLYSASCWEGSKPPGSGHTRAEAQTATCIPKTAARQSEPTYLSIHG